MSVDDDKYILLLVIIGALIRGLASYFNKVGLEVTVWVLAYCCQEPRVRRPTNLLDSAPESGRNQQQRPPDTPTMV